jgi:alpha-glucosidase
LFAIFLVWVGSTYSWGQLLPLNKDFCFSFPSGAKLAYTGGKFLAYAAHDTTSCMEFEREGDFLAIFEDLTIVKNRYASFKFRHRDLVKLESTQITAARKTNFGLALEGLAFNRRRKNAEKSTAKFSMEIEPSDDGGFRVTVVVYDRHYNRIRLALSGSREEQYFGGGAQFTHLNLTGKNVRIFSEEQGVGRGDRPLSFFTSAIGVSGDEFSTYAAVPYLIADRPGFKRGVFLECAEPLYFDLRRPERPVLDVWSHEFTFRMWTAATPAELTTKYSAHVGRPPLLPDWAFGVWLGVQGGCERVRKMLDKLAGAHVTAVWIQDWVGRKDTPIGARLRWHWEPDPKLYPDLKGFCRQLNQRNVKVLGYINPFLAEGTPMAEEALKAGRLVKNWKGQAYKLKAGGFNAYLNDFTHPQTQAFFKQVIQKNLWGTGFSGWMADFGEWLPLDARFHDGGEGWSKHNRYPVEWAKINREAAPEALFFCRSGYGHSPKYAPLFWMGDQTPDFGPRDGMPSALTGMLTAGLSGFALCHADVGGYTNVDLPGMKIRRTKEVYFRWAEWAAFTPVFRTHEGLKPEKNVQPYTDDETVAFTERMGKIRKILAPYLREVCTQASEYGWPAVRPLYFHYSESKFTHELKTQFLLGEYVMVAPVLRKGAREVEVRFPPGAWVHLFTGEKYGEGTAKVEAPYGAPPAFVRADYPGAGKLLDAFRALR